MRVGFRDLTVWSFLMASAHGAGLMLAPILLAPPMQGMHHAMDSSVASRLAGSAPSLLALAVLVHTLGLILVAGAVAILFYQFYEKRGLGLLRHTWFNFDLLWAVALILAGAAALVV
jgi:cation transport ATPase